MIPQPRNALANWADRRPISANEATFTLPSGCKVRTVAEPCTLEPWRRIAAVVNGTFIIVLCIAFLVERVAFEHSDPETERPGKSGAVSDLQP